MSADLFASWQSSGPTPGSPGTARPGGGHPVPHHGMPPLEVRPRALSAYEFWPMRLFYFPMALVCFWLMLRHRGITSPALANPCIEGGGLWGESKAAILDQAGPHARALIAPWVRVARGPSVDAALAAALAGMTDAGLHFPLVAKPDIGCRGAGVRVVADRDALAAYLAAFPEGAALVLQTLVDEEGEAGVFYARHPGAPAGILFSLTLKYFPRVVGDGQRCLRDLILADPRAGQIPHLYLPRHTAALDRVLAAGEPYRLAFAGSHSRGAIFRDGTALVTPAMTAAFDRIAKDLPEFWFGRFDVRFADIEALRRGEGFRIVEINGAGGEATHVWDAGMPLWRAWRDLARQYALAFAIGAANRRRGFRPPSIRSLWALWRRQDALMPTYPPTQ